MGLQIETLTNKFDKIVSSLVHRRCRAFWVINSTFLPPFTESAIYIGYKQVRLVQYLKVTIKWIELTSNTGWRRKCIVQRSQATVSNIAFYNFIPSVASDTLLLLLPEVLLLVLPLLLVLLLKLLDGIYMLENIVIKRGYSI